MSDPVNHPPHYGGGENPYEVIKVLRQWLTTEEFVGFLKGNTLKYLARHRRKGGDVDLEKGKFYQDYLVAFQAEQRELAKEKQKELGNW